MVLLSGTGFYITHVEVNNGRMSPILNLIKLNIFRACPSLKSHVLLYGNGIEILHGFPDIRLRILKHNCRYSRSFWPGPSFCPIRVHFRTHASYW